MQELGESYGNLFYASSASARRADEILALGGFTDADLTRGRPHEVLMASLSRSV